MGKERFLKELGLRREVAEPGEAKSETIWGDSESEDKKPRPPAEENSDAPEAELEAPQPIEESAEHLTEQPPAKEPATKSSEQPEVEEKQAIPAQIGEIEAEAVEDTGREGGAEMNLREDAGDEMAPDFTLFLGRKVADDL